MATVMEQGRTGKTLVHYHAQEGVAVLTLDDPPANAISHEMMRALDRGILEARFDESVSVIVLVGSGEKFFSAGADIGRLASASHSYNYHFCLHASETLSRLESTPKLVIAALNGHTVGGGLDLALAADLRIARREGGKCGFPEVDFGLMPGTGGTQRLARLVGKSRAIELLATGRTFEFEEAEKLGIVDEVYDADSRSTFLDQVLDFARQFTPPNRASKAVGHIKRAVQTGAELPLHEGLALERELLQPLLQSEDYEEGMRAYKRRKPVFEGR